jgi:hypothetical protein
MADFVENEDLELQNIVNMNFILKRITSKLGRGIRKQFLTLDQISEIVVRETLPIFSKYFPYEHIHTIKESDRIRGKSDGFYFVDAPTGIFSVNRMVGGLDTRMESMAGDNTVYNRGYQESLIETKINDSIAAATTLPITTKFKAPNICEVFPKGNYVGQSLICFCIHPVTLHTIPWGLADEFFELAYADYRIELLGKIEEFQNISDIIYGEINLNMEKLSRAEDDRKALLEKWLPKALKTGRKRWYVT